MRISDVLHAKGSADVVTIRPDAAVRELLVVLSDHNVGALVVSEDGVRPVGIVSERDVVRRLLQGDDVLDRDVASIMTVDIRACQPDDSLDDLMRLMTEHRVRHVPVVTEGRLAGIISIGDVVKVKMSELQFERDQLNSYVAGAQ
ncbi:MAG: CBS domain-containing protein [Nocardioidaceae bacterium]